jgi:hypothetical protein
MSGNSAKLASDSLQNTISYVRFGFRKEQIGGVVTTWPLHIAMTFYLLTFFQPAATPPHPEVDAQELHTQAVELMKAGKWSNAASLLDQAIKASSPPLPRSLVLNRALVDLRQRTTAMRAVRELTSYLEANQEPDEEAVNILGASLSLANKSARNGEVYRDGAEQLRIALAILASTRPTERKWGTQWFSEEAWASLSRQIAEAESRLNEARRHLGEAEEQLEQARARFQQANTLVVGARKIHKHREYVAGCEDCQRIREWEEAKAAVARAEKKVKEARKAAEHAEEAIPQPKWDVNLPPLEAETR